MAVAAITAGGGTGEEKVAASLHSVSEVSFEQPQHPQHSRRSTVKLPASMAEASRSGFEADFISFDRSPSPVPGPSKSSRHPSPPPPTPGGQEKGKSKNKSKGKGKKLGSGDEDTIASGAANDTPSKRARSVNGDDRAGKKRKEGANGAGPSNLKEERRAAERSAPWVDEVDWENCRDPAEMLNEEISAFYRYVSPTPTEYEVRLFVIELIMRAVHNIWPDAEVTPFGSWQTQLYLPTGDIDLVVKTDRLNATNKGRLLAELARAMRMAYITDTVAIISKARVPIIKFVTREGKLNVDISLNQTNGISAGRIVNSYLDVLPGARQLIVVVKAFLSQRSMNEVYTGGLGSYAVICLVISFLQVHPKLRRSELEPERNLGTLLIEFLELYGRNFNYDDVGISIRRGGFYYSKRSRGWQRQGQAFLLSIEDPQDRDNDISGGSFGIRQVRATLAGAYELLQAKLFERAEQITARRSGRYQGDWDGEEMSLLTAIMGVTKETLKHRKELVRLHEEGRLQRMLGIPPGALDLSAHFPHYDRVVPRQTASKSTPNVRQQPTGEQSAPRNGGKRRQTTPPVQAIVVDDDEVSDDFDMSDSEDGEIYESSKPTTNGRASDGKRDAQKGRYESVSHDEEDDSAVSTPTGDDQSESETRYELRQKKRNKRPIEVVDDDSDESVVEVSRPASPAGELKKEKRKAKVDKKAKRDFWNAKGQAVQVLEDSGEE